VFSGLFRQGKRGEPFEISGVTPQVGGEFFPGGGKVGAIPTYKWGLPKGGNTADALTLFQGCAGKKFLAYSKY